MIYVSALEIGYYEMFFRTKRESHHLSYNSSTSATFTVLINPSIAHAINVITIRTCDVYVRVYNIVL